MGKQLSIPMPGGRQKMSQGINGVQTIYTYEASSEYGAIHKVTTTVQANGSIVPGQSTRVLSTLLRTVQLPDKNSMFIQVKIGL